MNVGDAFDDEIRKLKMKIEESRKIKEARVSELAQVKDENAELIKKHEENKAALQEVEKELFRLEMAESELEAKIGSTNIRLEERIRVRKKAKLKQKIIVTLISNLRLK